MEPEISLSSSQDPDIGPNPDSIRDLLNPSCYHMYSHNRQQYLYIFTQVLLCSYDSYLSHEEINKEIGGGALFLTTLVFIVLK